MVRALVLLVESGGFGRGKYYRFFFALFAEFVYAGFATWEVA
jgi:hypothetical protein